MSLQFGLKNQVAYALILLLFCSTLPILAQDSNGFTDFHNMTEVELLKGLQHAEPSVRSAAAEEIRFRLTTSNVIVQPGNIIEHTREYWQEKVDKFKNWSDYDELEAEFNLKQTDRRPNFDNMKAYSLDNMFGMYVEQKKQQTKVRVVNFRYHPGDFRVKPPDNYTGLWREFYLTGAIHFETSYENGSKDGVSTIYHENGFPCWSKIYNQGKLMEMRGYTTDGKLKSKKIYTDEDRKNLKEYDYTDGYEGEQ